MEIKTEKVEELKEDIDVRRELEHTGTTGGEKPKIRAAQKFWIGGYVILLVAAGIAYYLSRFGFFGYAGQYAALIQRLTVGGIVIILLLLALKVVPDRSPER